MENLKLIENRDDFKQQLKEKLVNLSVGKSIQILVGNRILTVMKISEGNLKIVSKKKVLQ